MKLTLQQPIDYTKKIALQDTSCAQAFDQLLQTMETLPVASDGIVTCEAIMTDEICIVNCVAVAYSSPEENSPVVHAIPAGIYQFEQLPLSPTSSVEFMPLLNRFALSMATRKNSKTTIHVRLYKEGIFTIAVQFIAPIHTIEE